MNIVTNIAMLSKLCKSLLIHTKYTLTLILLYNTKYFFTIAKVYLLISLILEKNEVLVKDGFISMLGIPTLVLIPAVIILLVVIVVLCGCIICLRARHKVNLNV